MQQIQDYKPLIGHKKAQETILKLINDNKLPHAILLYGPKGIGKAKFAENLAYMLICGNNPASQANRFSININSSQYQRLCAGSLDEFKIIKPEDGKKQISVDVVRQSLNNIGLTSDNKRVIIIDSADELNPNSANAILKTLEEPPANTLLVLISSNPAKLLPTINSRCRKIKLEPLAEHEVELILEDLGYSNTQKALQFCNGSVEKAIDFLTDGTKILEALEGFFDKDKVSASDVIMLADKLADKQLKEALVYSQINEFFYNATRLANGINSSLENTKLLNNICKKYSHSTLLNAYEISLETQKNRNSINIGQNVCLENIFKEFIL